MTLSEKITYLRKRDRISQEELAEKLVYVFGKDFCLDGAIDKIIGGPPMKYRGALIRVFDNNVFMENEDISSLKEQ